MISKSSEAQTLISSYKVMRNFCVLLICFAFSCKQQAQEDPFGSDSLSAKKLDVIGAFDSVRIDQLTDIAKGTNEHSPAFIKKRLQGLVGNYLEEQCTRNGLDYPPKFILFQCFKYEKEFEVWAGNSNHDSLRRILHLHVCAIDAQPGTKIQMGDGKTPEGFYNATLQYGSPNDYMWIKLNNSETDTYGYKNYGSSFKIYLDYPNAIDKQRTMTVAKGKDPGNAIYIHGNCVTAGCISFENRNYLPVFLSALCHNSGIYGTIKTYVFPFRFDILTAKQRNALSKYSRRMKPEQLIETWSNLETGYQLFIKNRKALKINISKNTKYTFQTY